MPELIQVLESMPPTEQILGFHFRSDSHGLIGSCFTDITAGRLIGCTWVEKRQNAPELDPRLLPER
jgi:hypothetical protein